MDINKRIIALISYSPIPTTQTENSTPDPEISKRATVIFNAIKTIAEAIKSNIELSKKKTSYEYLDTDTTARIWIKEDIYFQEGMKLVVEHLKTLGVSKVVGHLEIVQTLSISNQRPLQKFIINVEQNISLPPPLINHQKSGS